ncbi:uncharacterized protein LOC144167578 [Haemaphysalis longicornis]|uniref:EF-hand domain-containing protein n=1 Tax=Haemaphysalis longicornis TaxID=44386 RepID=A0A9J6FWX1_HAELO|nr:hypothetical protein HPB48_010723 [Haemaphysalis longicornis]
MTAQPTSQQYSSGDDALMREVFAMMDRDCDLELSFEELKTAVRALGLAVTEAEMDEVREELEESTGRTAVDYVGFLSVLAKVELGHMLNARARANAKMEDTRRALEILDPTGSGLVSVRDVRWLLTTVGEKLSAEEADQVLDELGRQNGGVDDRLPLQDIVDMLFKDL